MEHKTTDSNLLSMVTLLIYVAHMVQTVQPTKVSDMPYYNTQNQELYLQAWLKSEGLEMSVYLMHMQSSDASQIMCYCRQQPKV